MKLSKLTCLIGVAFSLMSFSAEAGRLLSVPVLRYRADLTPSTISGSSVPVFMFRAGQTPNFSFTEIQSRFRIEISNLSDVSQPVKVYLRKDTEGESTPCNDTAGSVKLSARTLIRSFTLSNRDDSASLFVDYTCKSKESNGKVTCVLESNDVSYGSLTYDATKCATVHMAFTLALDIEINQNKGALSGILGTITNYNGADRGNGAQTFANPVDAKFRFDIVHQGAFGAIPLNGGRPF